MIDDDVEVVKDVIICWKLCCTFETYTLYDPSLYAKFPL